jgi:hypothetical protein
MGLPLFSLGAFCFEPLVFWGCIFFSSDVFYFEALAFWVASFFIGGLLF